MVRIAEKSYKAARAEMRSDLKSGTTTTDTGKHDESRDDETIKKAIVKVHISLYTQRSRADALSRCGFLT